MRLLTQRFTSRRQPYNGRAVIFVILTLTYIVAARLGFQLAFAAEQVTTVWAPTGIAIAAVLLWGHRLWPAIWVGAFVANLGSDAPLWTAAVVAAGNTLEALAAAWGLRKVRGFDPALRTVADVVAFAAIAVAASSVISASIGVVTLCSAGVQPWERFPILWRDWWLGDALGALVIAPAILMVRAEIHAPAPAWPRIGAFVAGAAACTHLVFGQLFGLAVHPFEYGLFLVVIAAAVRGGPTATALVVVVVSAVTISDTVAGVGPFAGSEVHSSLVLLQTFTGALAATGLLLAAAIAEREASERRERDAANVLRKREQLLRLAQRAGGVAAFEWDFRNQVAQCSAEFFHIFGLPAIDGVMQGATWAEFVHPDDRQRMGEHLARVLEGRETPSADYRIITAAGQLRWLSYAGQIQRTEAGERMLGTVVDITDRVAAEAALRESRDVLALAMRGGSMGAWSRDLATNRVWWSRELEEIVGLAPGTFKGREADFFGFVHEADRDRVAAAVRQAIASRTDYIVEFRFRHAADSWRWMEGRGRAVYDEDGSARMLYGIGIDVTDRKRAEAALLEAKAAAEAANQVKDQFLATLSHELRTPLNAILGYAQMLQTGAIAPDKRAHAIEVIERNAVAQNQLVDDLLDMSRIATGKIRLDPEPIPAAAVLGDALEGVKPVAEAKGIQLELDVDPSAGMVTADPARLQQVFWNLLTNAVKFTGPGGRVVARLARDGDHVLASVSDTGIGIAADFLPFVFEPFRQGDERIARGYGGLGLGLAISRQLVELHGGTIHAASDGPGLGAVFTLRLPAVMADAAALGRYARDDASLS